MAPNMGRINLNNIVHYLYTNLAPYIVVEVAALLLPPILLPTVEDLLLTLALLPTVEYLLLILTLLPTELLVHFQSSAVDRRQVLLLVTALDLVLVVVDHILSTTNGKSYYNMNHYLHNASE